MVSIDHGLWDDFRLTAPPCRPKSSGSIDLKLEVLGCLPFRYFRGPMSNINGEGIRAQCNYSHEDVEDGNPAHRVFVLGHVKLTAERFDQSFLYPGCPVGDQFPRESISHTSDKEQRPRKFGKYDYLLFFSNFNGTWNQYIDAFSAVLARA